VRAFRDCFDRSVGEIPDGPVDSSLPCGPNGEIAKPNALNPPANYESSGYHETESFP
jgi:hypothetical protein